MIENKTDETIKFSINFRQLLLKYCLISSFRFIGVTKRVYDEVGMNQVKYGQASKSGTQFIFDAAVLYFFTERGLKLFGLLMH